jgi:hypothetical protein
LVVSIAAPYQYTIPYTTIGGIDRSAISIHATIHATIGGIDRSAISIHATI